MSTIAAGLFFLSAHLLGPKETIAASRVWSAAEAVESVVEELPSLYEGPDGKRKTAELLFSIAYFESRLDPSAVNPAGDTGIVQVRSLWWRGHTRDEIIGNARLGFELGLRALLHLRQVCGGPTVRWLGAYASGVCGGGRSAALRRCGPVGLCEQR
jgi:soluble lytic murein transglycosylase-like protein